MANLTEKTLATERKYTGKIISVDLLDIELPDGRKAKREVIRHGNAVAILARRPGIRLFLNRTRRLSRPSSAHPNRFTPATPTSSPTTRVTT